MNEKDTKPYPSFVDYIAEGRSDQELLKMGLNIIIIKLKFKETD